MADAHWKVGTITVPGSTGNVVVTGLGGTPQAVFFYGTNWTTEDSAVTSSGTGLFRGMASPKWDSPSTILQNAATVCPAGDAHVIDNHAIIQINTAGAGAYLYGADLTSFDADGFTVNFFVAASGGYKVIYVALMDVDEIGAFIGSGTTSLSLGWKAGAGLLHGAWAGPAVGGTDRTQEYYGGAAFPGTITTGWFGAGLTAFTFPTSASSQHNINIFNQGPHIVVCQGGEFLGPFLVTGNVTASLSGGGSQTLNVTFLNNNGGMIVVWEDEASQTGRLVPAASQGGTVVVSGLPFAPGLVIGYSISDEPPGQGTGVRGAVGFSVVTSEFQWSALVDGASFRGAYQSFQRGIIDAANSTSVHAGTIELTSDGFIVTTEEDDISAQDWVWHAFGHPTPGAWIPQIYRLVMPT